MKEVNIKAHIRRGRNGKPINVRGYTRRVGRKGVISPRRSKKEHPDAGDELAAKMAENTNTVQATTQEATEKKTKKLTPEEVALAKEVAKGFEKAERNIRAKKVSPEKYARMRLREYLKKYKEGKPRSKNTTGASKNVKSEKGSREVFSKIERILSKGMKRFEKWTE